MPWPELDLFYNEPARFISSKARELLTSHNEPSSFSSQQLKLARPVWPIDHTSLGNSAQPNRETLTLYTTPSGSRHHLFCFVLEFCMDEWVICKLYQYDYRGLIIKVVVGWLDKNFVKLWINRWMDYILHC